MNMCFERNLEFFTFLFQHLEEEEEDCTGEQKEVERYGNLIQAAKHGNLEEIKSLPRYGAHISFVDESVNICSSKRPY